MSDAGTRGSRGPAPSGDAQAGGRRAGSSQAGLGRSANGRSANGGPGNGGPGRVQAQNGDVGTIVLAGAAPGQRRHDPRIDQPTRADRRRLWKWGALLAFCPICLAVVVWAALDMNGSYPTVKPPVPSGWQSVPGIYASFSAPGSWSLKQFLSDASGDVYYSGAGGGVGESVTQADRAPNVRGPLPEIVGTFLGWKYKVNSVSPTKIANATMAWRYHFHLVNGTSSVGVLAWVKPTQSEVWLIASKDSATTEKALSTLTLAS
jgi:hypothetical protein